MTCKQLQPGKTGIIKIMSKRKAILEIITNYAAVTGKKYGQLWAWFYESVSHTAGYDIIEAARSHGCKPMDIIEQDGLLDDALRIVNEMYRIAS